MATYSSILAWRIHGQISLAGYSPWGCKELDTAEQLTYTHTQRDRGMHKAHVNKCYLRESRIGLERR